MRASYRLRSDTCYPGEAYRLSSVSQAYISTDANLSYYLIAFHNQNQNSKYINFKILETK